MRRIKVFILAALMPCGLHASFSNTVQWEVRTTGTDANGGGFDPYVTSPGTDYSQQNSPQQAYTDIVIGGTTTHGTSAARPFTSVDVGNIINITGGSGCTVQRNEITSVAANVATFTTALGTAASTCTGNEGGGLLTINSISAANPTAAQLQNVIWVRSGTYTTTATNVINSYIALIGYKTIHGDNPTGTDRPLITTATNSVSLISVAYNSSSVANNYVFLNLRFSNTAGTRASGIVPSSFVQQRLSFRNCQFDGFTKAVSADAVVGGTPLDIHMSFSEVMNSTQVGIASQSDLTLSYSYIHDNLQGGVEIGGQYSVDVDHTVFQNNGGYGIRVASSNTELTLTGNVFYGTTTAGGSGCGTTTCSALLFASSAGPYGFLSMMSNIFYGNSGWNISATDISLPIDQINSTNAFKAGGSGNINVMAGSPSGGIVADSPAGVTLTVDPFTNAAGADFSLNNTVGGGAALKGVGFPGVSGLFGTGYLDINVLQSQAPTGAVQINAIY